MAGYFLPANCGFFRSDASGAMRRPRVSRARKPELANPLPAIVDFHHQLRARGIELVVVPVPPKAAIYPEKFVPGFDLTSHDPAPVLRQFYEELRASRHRCLDPFAHADPKSGTPARAGLLQNGQSLVGNRMRAGRAGDRGACSTQADGAARVRKEYVSDWNEVQVNGDLAGLLPPDARKPGPEKISVQSVSEKGTGAVVEPDPNSPVLVIGDSHTLVYHDFLAERAGLIDQLALELGFAPDLIGTRGSGATPVRINLYRRSLQRPRISGEKKGGHLVFRRARIYGSDRRLG